MNLPQRDQRPRLLAGGRADLQQKDRPVAFDSRAGILFGESEIQRLSPINAGRTADASAESVDQPRNVCEVFGTNDRHWRFVDALSH